MEDLGQYNKEVRSREWRETDVKVVYVMEGEDGRGRSAPLRRGGGGEAQDSRRFKRGRERGKRRKKGRKGENEKGNLVSCRRDTGKSVLFVPRGCSLALPRVN